MRLKPDSLPAKLPAVRFGNGSGESEKDVPSRSTRPALRPDVPCRWGRCSRNYLVSQRNGPASEPVAKAKAINKYWAPATNCSRPTVTRATCRLTNSSLLAGFHKVTPRRHDVVGGTAGERNISTKSGDFYGFIYLRKASPQPMEWILRGSISADPKKTPLIKSG